MTPALRSLAPEPPVNFQGHVFSDPFEIAFNSSNPRPGDDEATGTARRPSLIQLLDFDFCASFFEFLLGVIGVGFVGALKHRLRRAFD